MPYPVKLRVRNSVGKLAALLMIIPDYSRHAKSQSHSGEGDGDDNECDDSDNESG